MEAARIGGALWALGAQKPQPRWRKLAGHVWIRVPGRRMRREKIEDRIIASYHELTEMRMVSSFECGAFLSCIASSALPCSADEKGNAEGASDEDSEPVSQSSAHITMACA